MKHFILAVFVLFTVNANANYIKGATGVTIGGKTKTDSASANLDDDFLTPFIVAYGYSLDGDLMGEFEFSYRNNDYDGPGKAKAEVIAFAFNIAQSWVLQNNMFLTAGAGPTLGNYDLASGGGAKDGIALGLQGFFGMDFKVADKITIGGEFRHFRTLTKVDIGTEKASFNNTSLLFVAKFDM